VGVGVIVGVLVGVAVAVTVGEDVGALVRVAVTVGVLVPDGVADGVKVAVGAVGLLSVPPQPARPPIISTVTQKQPTAFRDMDTYLIL